MLYSPLDKQKQRREENEKKQMLERNKKKTNVKVTDIKGNPIVFNALTEKPFRFTSKQRIDRTPELSERKSRAIKTSENYNQKINRRFTTSPFCL